MCASKRNDLKRRVFQTAQQNKWPSVARRGVLCRAFCSLLTQIQSFTKPGLSVRSTTAHFLLHIKLHNNSLQEKLLKRQEKK